MRPDAPEPLLPDAALSGPVGDWVRDAAQYTEADPAALLVSTLVACGVVVGRAPHFWAGDARQTAALCAVVVADTPKANRGLSWSITRRLIEVVDPQLVRRILTGLGNGKTVVDALGRSSRDRVPPGEPRMGGPGRLLAHEPGLTRALELGGRPSSPLPLVIRTAWDGTPLEWGRARISGHHMGIVAHATLDQLTARLSLTGGSVHFVNRFVYVIARRQRPVIDEGNVPADLLLTHGRRLHDQLAIASTFGAVQRSPSAERRWRTVYGDLVDDDPGGLLGIIVARAARHVLRLALVYALTEASPRIECRHIDAALALWTYCRASASVICRKTSTPSKDLSAELLAAISAAGERGLSFTEQHDMFGRNMPASRLRTARSVLEEAGHVVSTKERRPGSARAITVTRLSTRTRR